jgi:hypothetical protein
VLWAADVWYSIKKAWVGELQRLIRARRGEAAAAGGPAPQAPLPGGDPAPPDPKPAG